MCLQVGDCLGLHNSTESFQQVSLLCAGHLANSAHTCSSMAQGAHLDSMVLVIFSSVHITS